MMRYVIAHDPATSADALVAAQTEVFGAADVEIKLDYHGRRVWVNVNGICLLRICEITGALVVDRPLFDTEVPTFEGEA